MLMETRAMALRTVWRRLTARRRRRQSFYESQEVMRKAVEAEGVGKKAVSPVQDPKASSS